MPVAKSHPHVDVTCAVNAGVPPTSIRRWAEQAVKKLPLPVGRISIAVVGATASRRANGAYREKPYPTNVLSFVFSPAVDGVIGEILLCPTVIRREARGPEYPQRFRFLLQHGLIHLCGFDHHTRPEQRRWDRYEKRLLRL